jgi:hypothetical protein
MKKGFMFVMDALLALSLIGLLSAGIVFSLNSGNEINSAAVSSIQARDKAVIGIHQDIESDTAEESYYSKVCFKAVRNGSENNYCKVIQ